MTNAGMTNAGMTSPHALDRAVAEYRRVYGAEPTLVVRAPGRVNLIGEHTDYNDGFVLPMALPFDVVIAGVPRTDRRVLATSEGYTSEGYVSTGYVSEGCDSEGYALVEFAIDDAVEPGSWHTYVHGTAAMLIDSGHQVAGWQACLASDIPAGASLSSSAALEIASGLAFTASVGQELDARTLARVGQRVENEILGLPSGIMDQLASAGSIDGAASLIDCRDLSTTSVPLPDDIDVVVMDTGTRRELVDSEYATRRADCEAAAAQLGVAALRDADATQLGMIDDNRVMRRARHVISENARTLEAAAAMQAGDPITLGKLMDESHASLRDDFEVSSPALDRMVELARRFEGCLGARMTGGGFAGAAVAIVRRNATAAFVATLLDSYQAPAAQPATAPVQLYVVRPAPGASVLVRPASS